jgi:alpha-ketoglutaric semialdehyde dehydrogenase
MSSFQIPDRVAHWIDGREQPSREAEWFDKVSPADGRVLAKVARGRAADTQAAIDSAARAQPAWANTPGVRRGEILFALCRLLEDERETIARVVHLETGKSLKDALGETDGAIALGRFFAGEGQRLYGRTMPSAALNKYAMTVRQPIGVAGLIIAANTPIANVAWKVFPALICGNGAVLKGSEDTPITAWLFAAIAQRAGLPAGVLNVVQGYGDEAGAPLALDERVGVLSFTGSTRVGRWLAERAGQRLARLSLELGGKNPLVVCDDADLERAVKWVALSAFSNAGQRCASASRVIVFESVYEEFVTKLVEHTRMLKVGSADSDFLGPVINARQCENILAAVAAARAAGARVLLGGTRLSDAGHERGFFIAPTLIDGVDPSDPISQNELFGPVACIYPARDFEHALALANDSPYGLTACIHTRNVHRAIDFAHKVQSGVAVVNMGTYGSEPHMPFGGRKNSGNGSREPGTEALDVYSELKDIYIGVEPDLL